MTQTEILEAAEICKENKLPLNGLHLHLWVEGFFELFATVMVAIVYSLLGIVSRKTAARVIYLDAILFLGSGIIGTGHHWYWTGQSNITMALGAVKRRGERTRLLTDGGMADNPRHALYGARYSCLTVADVGREKSERVFIAGPYCESGDILIEDLPMPKIEAGELIAFSFATRGLNVPASGLHSPGCQEKCKGAEKILASYLR